MDDTHPGVVHLFAGAGIWFCQRKSRSLAFHFCKQLPAGLKLIQLHHGTADADVTWEFSEMLYEDMLTAGQEVEFYSYDGDYHNISKYFNQAMQRTIEFFDQYVK